NTDFPIQNLPFCVVEDESAYSGWTVAIIIGDQVFGFERANDVGLFQQMEIESVIGPDVTDISQLLDNRYGSLVMSGLRKRLVDILKVDADEEDKKWAEQCLRPVGECNVGYPFSIGDYTDFYCSIYHATNVGSMFRPDNPLMP
ncbi:MAG TPA: fumarylacetoacetase, partial [Blastocatellia bacterium]|nr:fumarylacetoacetase [Blastocatellia bacterium]